MEPSQVRSEVSGGDAAPCPEEILEAGMAIVDGVDVQIAPHPLASGLVERFVTDAQGGGTGRVAGLSGISCRGGPNL